MKKIPSLFQRDSDGARRIRNEVVPGCEWVLVGEGRATVKVDGTACLVRGGRLFKRYDAKHGKTPPPDFEPCADTPNDSGHWPGWLPVGDGPDDRWHREAFALMAPLADGTYELIGPKVQGNPYQLDHHELSRHGATCAIDDIPGARSFEGIRSYLRRVPIEGIVYWHPDGRVAKVKRRDYGIDWPPKEKR